MCIYGVLTILGLARYFVFCVSVKVKLTVLLLCVCMHSACKGRPRNDLYCVGWDFKPYSLTHSLYFEIHIHKCFTYLCVFYISMCLSVGPTVFRGKFCGPVRKILRLTTSNLSRFCSWPQSSVCVQTKLHSV